MRSSKIIMVGGFHEIVEQMEHLDIELLGIIDNKKTDKFYGFPILGTDLEAEFVLNKHPTSKLLITPDIGKIRKELFETYSVFGHSFFTLISKFSTVSNSSTIGMGSILSQKSHISSEVKIGKFCKINVAANIMHDSKIGDFSTLAPNSVVLGNVQIGKLCYIGANSTILPNIKLGNNVVVGAGAVVTKNVPDNRIVKGIPAK